MSLLVRKSLSGTQLTGSTLLIRTPDAVSALVDGQRVELSRITGPTWGAKGVLVRIEENEKSLGVSLEAPSSNLFEVTLHWRIPSLESVSLLNDHWERTYGDVSWHRPKETEVLPWYFLEYHDDQTAGYGVRTGAGAFCSWRVGNNSLDLTLDTRNGGEGVSLGERVLSAAEIVTVESEAGESSYETTRRFIASMCDKPRMPKKPVYGINDWYSTYGHNSEALILEHTALMAPMADGLKNRPFSVIDAGWFRVSPDAPDDISWSDDMGVPNDRFGDMHRMAEKIKGLAMRPGIWTRPLCGSSTDPVDHMLPMIAGREKNKPVLDPSIPENLERVKKLLHLYNAWGHELVKFDYTSFDLFGRWGFQMVKAGTMTEPGWHMHDRSKTNAEIILDLYRAVRESAGDACVISCNTFSHLAAGLFELNRIGDDTSGVEWERTRRMGVNTLAFRGVHHGLFYAADPDCVGLTEKVAWEKNKQWMELVARCGTPLFISAEPRATGQEQKAWVRKCFALAAHGQPLGRPLDWMEGPVPSTWMLEGSMRRFSWD
jgi:alpha-galactosidase